jgi:protein-L-isoaspartate(D-aspartate) O-methyltransferase
MVRTQLQRRGIQTGRVLHAMSQVPREQFVPGPWYESAYHDCALPIDCGQTISQPYTVAFMCESLGLEGNEKVLEVGTGSGYGAAVLSLLAREVHTVERIPQLGREAQARLEQLGYANVRVHIADGSLGWPEQAPYHAIVVTAGAEMLPKPYLDQLVDDGRIVIPLGRDPRSQNMYRFTMHEGRVHVENLGGFAFVPLIGQYGWDA